MKTGLLGMVIALREKIGEGLHKVLMRKKDRDDTLDEIGNVTGAEGAGLTIFRVVGKIHKSFKLVGCILRIKDGLGLQEKEAEVGISRFRVSLADDGVDGHDRSEVEFCRRWVVWSD